MECNKEEAIRAKLIAERKIMEKDFDGAKKFVLKAHTLYPGLEGLSHMLITVDVYISAENRVSGEVDWYGVLGVNPSDDPETVRKQYRKLALMLHPDKNKSMGAEGAFKLLSEAWSLLSDRVRRLEYNRRRASQGFQQRVPNNCKGPPSATSKANGFHNFSNIKTSNAKTQNNWVPQSFQRTDAFWTICHRCKMYYEYLRVYLNNMLLCTNCNQAFLASETWPPLNFSEPPNSSSQQRYQNVGGCHSTNSRNTSLNHANMQQAPFARTAGNTGSLPSVASKAGYVGQQAIDKLKRHHEEAQGAGGRGRFVKKTRGLDDNGNGSRGNTTCQTAMGSSFRFYGFSGLNRKPNSIKELMPFEIQSMLIHKARTEIFKKLNECSLENVTKAANTKKEKANGKQKQRSSVKSVNDKEEVKPLSINVPDPDFHDFDQDRMESSFGDNQVWAAYDTGDSMPRFYGMIHKAISLNPFKLQGPRGTICIFPRKGDVWALYRNWSPYWNRNTPDEVVQKYDMVLVLEDYNVDQGVSVAPLIKISGFRTVYCGDMGPDTLRRIPRQEMLQFSHQVPNYLLTGLEAQNAPKGCLELDPAATPLELLQVVTDADVATMEVEC
ncbi:hypothetical protein RHSIM_Rhsim03G0200500 [Rhododendron simsii]|uniref:J domain-containing protein n=1 Tax=Rhododendron simsii TaxID=118357 RepID=A0A834H6J0_RHOSS|nr:hypothetical protein RHSIM_Rhsim03G0200500 [Rhododendron simsii]